MEGKWTLTTMLLGADGSKRRQALAEAQSSVNKVATKLVSVHSAASARCQPAAPPQAAAGGGTWVRDGTKPVRTQRSKRQVLLAGARMSLQKAQASVTATGRGIQQVYSHSVSAALAKRALEMRSEQEAAGRHVGRARQDGAQAQLFAQSEAAGKSAADVTAEERESEHVTEQRECTERVEEVGAVATAPERHSDTSRPFDFFSDDELLYSYQVVLDELEDADNAGRGGIAEETDENEIIALAILRMQLPTDMAAVANVRLQEMVGLCRPNEFSPSEAVEPSQRAAEEAVSALADGDDQDDGDYISAHAMTPGLAQRLGMRPDLAQS